MKVIRNKMKAFVRRVHRGISYRLVRVIDGIRDWNMCSHTFTRNMEACIEGSTGYEATCYWTLDEIFKDTDFTANDHFVDVGCGEGRVIAWLLSKKFPGRVTGIELDPELASVAKEWISQRVSNNSVRLIEGDALKQSYDEYTIIYIFRPFEGAYFLHLIKRLEATLTHPIRLYYLTDYFSGRVLANRPGWTMIKRDQVYKKYGLCMWGCPQNYSIWQYTPCES